MFDEAITKYSVALYEVALEQDDFMLDDLDTVRAAYENSDLKLALMHPRIGNPKKREIIEGIREACGPDFVIGCRLNGREFHPTKQGITAEQAAENARAFVEAGAQYISIAGYGYGPTPFRYCPDYFPYPEPDPFMEPFMDEYRGVGLWTAVARRIKDAVETIALVAKEGSL